MRKVYVNVINFSPDNKIIGQPEAAADFSIVKPIERYTSKGNFFFLQSFTFSQNLLRISKMNKISRSCISAHHTLIYSAFTDFLRQQICGEAKILEFRSLFQHPAGLEPAHFCRKSTVLI